PVQCVPAGERSILKAVSSVELSVQVRSIPVCEAAVGLALKPLGAIGGTGVTVHLTVKWNGFAVVSLLPMDIVPLTGDPSIFALQNKSNVVESSGLRFCEPKKPAVKPAAVTVGWFAARFKPCVPLLKTVMVCC